MLKKLSFLTVFVSAFLSINNVAYADDVIISDVPGEPFLSVPVSSRDFTIQNPHIVEPLHPENIINLSIGMSTSYYSGKGQEIVSYALQFVGNPYVYGGISLTEGADCSGFVMRVFENFGINTGRDSRSQAAKCRKISLNELRPGDLLFYADGDSINHVAIYIGNNKIVHAQGKDTGITVSDAFYKIPYMAGTFLS